MNDKKYLISDIRIDGVEYPAEFYEFAERERQGLVAEEEIKKLFPNVGHTVITEESRERQRQGIAELAKAVKVARAIRTGIGD